MDQREIQAKANELEFILQKYDTEMGVLERELLKAIAKYHEALKQERLKKIREAIT